MPDGVLLKLVTI